MAAREGSEGALPPPRIPAPLLGLAALAGGAGSMAIEMTAVRLLAPWFGTSVYAWTNLIGVVLAALAAGYLLGGRLAARPRPALLAGWLLLGAGALAGAAPFLLPPLAGLFREPDLPLEAALGALAAASLPVGGLLFGPPVLLLGMVPPLLVQGWVGGKPERAGRVSGTVFALGTLGSLAGTFLPTFWLVPNLGSRATLWVAGALLAAAGLPLAWPRRAGALLLSALPLAGLGAALVLPGGPAGFPPAYPSDRILWETESPYQFVRVVERLERGRPVRLLLLNEGLDSFHSVALAGEETSGGRYYDALALATLLGGADLAAGGTALSLGVAGGTTLGLLRRLYGPRFALEGVEIDPACVAAGRLYLGFPADARVHAGVDARLFARLAPGPYRYIELDAYASQIYLPWSLATREFFADLARLLEPGGVAAVNVADPSPSGVLVRPLARTLAAALGEVLLFRIPDSRNYMVAAGQGLDPARLTGPACPAPLRELAARLVRPGAWERVGTGGGEELFTDDRAPVERLTWAAYREAREEALR